MTQRKTPSLAYSEYVSPDFNNSPETWFARGELIEAVKRVHPIMLQKLMAEVFPIYYKLAVQRAGLDGMIAASNPFRRLKNEDVLRAALLRWADEFNAKPDWLLDDVLRNFKNWRREPDWRESLRWDSNRGRRDSRVSPQNLPNEGVGLELRFQVQCEAWPPLVQTWDTFETYARRRFEKELKEYERSMRRLAEDAGWLLARRQYSSYNLEWFVLYQFAGMSAKKIVDHRASEAEESTVFKGVKTAATLIGWDHLREPRQTRSRKTR